MGRNYDPKSLAADLSRPDATVEYVCSISDANSGRLGIFRLYNADRARVYELECLGDEIEDQDRIATAHQEMAQDED